MSILFRLLGNPLASVTGANKGYFAGGFTGLSSINVIDGINFATLSGFTGANTLPSVAWYAVACNSSSAGYILAPINNFASAQKMLFSNETTSTLAALANIEFGTFFSGASSINFGLFACSAATDGENSFDSSLISVFRFVNETSYTAGVATGSARHYGGATYSATDAFFGMGRNIGGAFVNQLSQVDFATITSVTSSSTFATNRIQYAGVSSTTKGYYGGGATTTNAGTAQTNSIEAVTFSTASLATLSATLSSARRGLTSTGTFSSEIGYWGGGVVIGNYTNSITGIIFATETSQNPAATLSNSREGTVGYQSYTSSGTGVAGRGYFAGGSTLANNNNAVDTIEGLTYSTESSGAVSATLATARHSLTSMASSTVGYFAGGATTNSTSDALTEVDGIIFASETATNPSAALSQGARRAPSAVNDLNRAFIAGGITTGAASSNVISSFLFSAETFSAVSATLVTARSGMSNVSSFSTGYWIGGGSGTGSTPSSEVDGILFSTQTQQDFANLTSGFQLRPSGGVQNALSGYYAGGFNASATNIIRQIVFSTNASQALSATLSAAKQSMAGAQSTAVGYFAGGLNQSNILQTTIDTLHLNTQISYTLGATLSAATQLLAGVSRNANSSIFQRGYVANGSSTAASPYTPSLSTLNGLMFGAKTSFVAATSLLNSAQLNTGANSATKGYIAGGYSESVSGNLSSVTSYTFDSEAMSYASGALALSVSDLMSVMSSTNGFFVGGWTGSATTSVANKLIFSTEALTTTSTLLQAISAGAANNSSTKGYLHGGTTDNTATSRINTIRAFTFGTETWATPAATLDATRLWQCGFNSASTGYTAGGWTTVNITTIASINFSTEAEANIGAALGTARRRSGAVNSTLEGFIMGGATGTEPTRTSNNVIDQLAFSTNTRTTLSATLATATHSVSSNGIQTGGIT